MTYSNLKPGLDKITSDLAKINGVDGSLIADGDGEVLSHHIRQDADTDLFGPMANVITSSSKRLINYANQGKIEQVLVESKRGKALFLHLGNVHFIVLMDQKANIGLVRISSKRAAEKIMDLTKDLSRIQLEEHVAEAGKESYEVTETSSEQEKPVEAVEKLKPWHESVAGLKLKNAVKINDMGKKGINTEVQPTSEVEATTIPEALSEEPLTEQGSTGELTAAKKSESQIPIIKPPIAFPALEKVVKMPEDEEERANLILNIYETIFRAMSIGASKIMGVTPARGLTRKFLPVADCKKLLKGVDVKSNSTIDFEKIKENANKIPLSKREVSFIEDFTKIIDVITEKYGQVMGYGAFRGMVRPEFKIINYSYREVIDELGIREKMHPELLDLFE